MFEALSDRLDSIFTRIRGGGVLSDDDVDEVLKEIRVALLEADVNFTVVKGFISRLREELAGAELSKSLNPYEQVVKAVHDELVATLGGETLRITYASKPPTVVLMAGLQGAGKTTTSAKLARWFKAQGRNPMLVGADLQRPAAVEQLRTLGRQVEVPVFSEPTDPVEVARSALAEAKQLGRDVVIVDTAGRLAIDADLMEQVREISEVTSPHYTFLVIDAMTGQDAVTTAEAFHQTLALDGVILTKLDGDARGGAALSVKEVVGCPIAFASTGEKLKDFDLFHPDRLAGRILGMGDVMTLIEQAEEAFEQEEAEEAAAKLIEGQFTLEDFLKQMQQVKKMGPLTNIVKMLPGIPKELRNTEIDDRELARIEGIIHSMTVAERQNPDLIDASRRSRIAAGCGMQAQDVANLLTQFKQMQHIMKQSFGMGSKRTRKGRKDKAVKRKGPGGGRAPQAGGRATPKGGGRVTPKGGGRVTPKKPKLALPGLDEGADGAFDPSALGLPEGFDGLGR